MWLLVFVKSLKFNSAASSGGCQETSQVRIQMIEIDRQKFFFFDKLDHSKNNPKERTAKRINQQNVPER